MKKFKNYINKNKKKILIIFVIWCCMVTTDYTLSCFDKRPIFALPLVKYMDGGTVEWYGLGYKIIKYHKIEPSPNGMVLKEGSRFGFWTMQYDD